MICDRLDVGTQCSIKKNATGEDVPSPKNATGKDVPCWPHFEYNMKHDVFLGLALATLEAEQGPGGCCGQQQTSLEVQEGVPEQSLSRGLPTSIKEDPSNISDIFA